METFEYMRWAKSHEGAPARYALNLSGMLSPSHVPAHWLREPISLTHGEHYSSGPLGQRLAQRYSVDAKNVFLSCGTSLANYQLLAALLRPGDHVLVEEPTYEALLRLPVLFGATRDRLPRRFENGFQIDPDELRAHLRQRPAHCCLITHFHNPSGAGIEDDQGRELAQICAEFDCTLVVDEVYRTFLSPSSTSFHWGENVATTASLTKAYGLSGLRAGWIFARESLIADLWDRTDLMHVHMPGPCVEMACRFLDDPGILEENLIDSQTVRLPRLLRTLDEIPELEYVKPAGGLIAFPRLRGSTSSRALVEYLEQKFEVAVVPGHHFEMDAHFRIGCALESEALEPALQVFQQGVRSFLSFSANA